MKRRRTIGFVALFTFRLWAMLVAGVAALVLGREPHMGLATPALLVDVAVIAWSSYGPCAACGKTFCHRGAYGNPLASKCLHCGIRQGASAPTPLTNEGSRALYPLVAATNVAGRRWASRIC